VKFAIVVVIAKNAEKAKRGVLNSFISNTYLRGVKLEKS
jgi:hypothetical protein